MTARQRKMLAELQEVTAYLGNKLDGTATHPHKYQLRQRAHTSVSKVLYGVLVDHPDNDQRENDLEEARIHLDYLQNLSRAEFSDRSGSGLLTSLIHP